MCAKRVMGVGQALCLIALGLATGGAGCGPRSSAPAPRGVRLELVDHDGLMAAVAARKGRVVVLDCWSTSCPPCVAEFPGLVKLAAAHRDRVACMSLAFDYEGIGKVEDVVTRVRGFLEQVGAVDVFNMLAMDDADLMYARLDLASVPAVYVWGPDGKLAVRFDDDYAARVLGRSFTYADVERKVQELLAADSTR